MTEHDLPEIGSIWVSRPRGGNKRWGQTVLEVIGYHVYPQTNYTTVEVRVLKCEHTPADVGKVRPYNKRMSSYIQVEDLEGVDVIPPRT